MRQMIRAQQPGRGGFLHRFDERDEFLAQTRARFEFVHADAEGIEHRRDPGRRDLRVIGEHRAAGVPHHRRTRHVMGFQMVGVQFDETGQEIVAVEVDGRSRFPTLAHFDDAPPFDGDMTFEDAVGGDDRRIGEEDRIAREKFHASGSVSL